MKTMLNNSTNYLKGSFYGLIENPKVYKICFWGIVVFYVNLLTTTTFTFGKIIAIIGIFLFGSFILGIKPVIRGLIFIIGQAFKHSDLENYNKYQIEVLRIYCILALLCIPISYLFSSIGFYAYFGITIIYLTFIFLKFFRLLLSIRGALDKDFSLENDLPSELKNNSQVVINHNSVNIAVYKKTLPIVKDIVPVDVNKEYGNSEVSNILANTKKVDSREPILCKIFQNDEVKEFMLIFIILEGLIRNENHFKTRKVANKWYALITELTGGNVKSIKNGRNERYKEIDSELIDKICCALKPKGELIKVNFDFYNNISQSVVAKICEFGFRVNLKKEIIILLTIYFIFHKEKIEYPQIPDEVEQETKKGLFTTLKSLK